MTCIAIPNYDFNDQILLKGVAYWVQLVESRLQDNTSA